MATGQPLAFDVTPDELVLFLSEGEEQLELLSQDLLRLEQEGDSNSELLQEIFRAAHTLKGSSGAIGHTRMAKLTHAVETVLDQVRHHTLPVTTRIIDLLLQSLDALRVLLEEVTTLVESDVAIDDLAAALNAIAAGEAPAPASAPAAAPRAAPAAAPPATTPSGLFEVQASISPECLLPAVRALQILLAAGSLGTVTTSDPTSEAVESGQVSTGQRLTLTLDAPTATAEQVRQTLGNILEVTVESVTGANGASAPAPAPKAAPAPAAPPADGETLWRVEADISPNCALPAARALQVLLGLAEVGAVRDSSPTLEEIETAKVEAGAPIVVLLMASGDRDAVTASTQAVLERILEVQFGAVEVAETEVLLQGSPEPAPVVATPAAASTPVAAAPSAPAAPVQPAQPTVAPAKAAPAAKPAEHAEVNHAPRMIRIDVERLDALMNLVGELVIDRTRLARISSKLAAHAHDPALAEELTETSRHLARISDDLQDEVMRSRMQPIESVFSKFPRLVRDLAQKVDKKIDFIVEGKDTELDRSVAEQIGDPIIHLLRNSIDHGVEPGADRLRAGKNEAGQVRLSARHEENQIVIDVEDDGRGINAEAIKQKAVNKGIINAEAAARMSNREALELIFASGFSTAEKISDISGRGVGMDIVRTNVERLNGSVTVETEVGQGTRFTVRLPLTLAIIRALLISVGGQTYAVPLTSVVEALRIERDKLRSVNGREAIELRGQVLPLLRLREIFAEFSGKSEAVEDRPERQFVVAVRWGERRGGLIVDALIGEQEIVIKPLGTLFRSAHGISGGAVLGDGQVAPILDIAALIKHIQANELGMRATAVSA
jgi:two-component system, chemotaxis family, sensor kinase CheA